MRLARIIVYPFKSLDGVDVPSARLLPSGGLANDRRFAICDAAGDFLNAKRAPRVHGIAAQFDVAAGRGRFAPRDSGASSLPPLEFELGGDPTPVEAWLGAYFEMPVRVVENTSTGMPDDLDAPGPTIVAAATLRRVGSWFGFDAEEAVRRFRPNLIVDPTEEFWEDRLYGPEGVGRTFRAGEVLLEGSNPCQRCPVPARDARTGEATPMFAREFGRRREETLPAWAERARFDHFYRLATNTRLSPRNTGRKLAVDDPVSIEGTQP